MVSKQEMQSGPPRLHIMDLHKKECHICAKMSKFIKLDLLQHDLAQKSADKVCHKGTYYVV